jgi:uncharacterized membrane protein
MKKIGRAPYAMLGLALVGGAVALYDSHAVYNGQPLWCPAPFDGCNAVASSPYAHVLGLPVGYFGVVYYLGMAGLAVLLAFDRQPRALRVLAVGYAALGASFSIYFMYVQFGFIHAFCIYCFVSAVATFLLLAAALRHLRPSRLRIQSATDTRLAGRR